MNATYSVINLERVTANTSGYIAGYRARLVTAHGPDIDSKITGLEGDLRRLPVCHSTSVEYLPQILKTGLLSLDERNKLQSATIPYTCNFRPDHEFELIKYVFANLGYCPGYSEGNGKVTILIDGVTLEDPEAFFTFYDPIGLSDTFDDLRDLMIAGINPKEIPMETRQNIYMANMMAANYLYRILAMICLHEGYSLEDCLANKYKYDIFPMAFSPHKKFSGERIGTRPEIKIPGSVKPEHFLGFAVWDTFRTKKMLARLDKHSHDHVFVEPFELPIEYQQFKPDAGDYIKRMLANKWLSSGDTIVFSRLLRNWQQSLLPSARDLMLQMGIPAECIVAYNPNDSRDERKKIVDLKAQSITCKPKLPGPEKLAASADGIEAILAEIRDLKKTVFLCSPQIDWGDD